MSIGIDKDSYTHNNTPEVKLKGARVYDTVFITRRQQRKAFELLDERTR